MIANDQIIVRTSSKYELEFLPYKLKISKINDFLRKITKKLNPI